MKTRPPTVWLHLPADPDVDVVGQLQDALADASPETELVFTKSGKVGKELLQLGEILELNLNSRDMLVSFLSQYDPCSVGWLDSNISASIFATIAERKIPIHIIDTGRLIEACNNWHVWRRFVRSPFRNATSITIGDNETHAALLTNGARARSIHMRGILESGPTALPFSQADRDTFMENAGPRPVWLAAGLLQYELDAIIAAHLQALRRSHRLLLILQPDESVRLDSFVSALEKAGLSYRRRSLDEDPSPDTQVYLADLPDEMGLWYRIASVAFMGATLTPGRIAGPDPLDAATLGCVVIHGPETGGHAVGYSRLHRANAARKVGHSGELAYTLDGMLSPERAAQIALAAWTISTTHADVISHAVETFVSDIRAFCGDPA